MLDVLAVVDRMVLENVSIPCNGDEQMVLINGLLSLIKVLGPLVKYFPLSNWEIELTIGPNHAPCPIGHLASCCVWCAALPDGSDLKCVCIIGRHWPVIPWLHWGVGEDFCQPGLCCGQCCV